MSDHILAKTGFPWVLKSPSSSSSSSSGSSSSSSRSRSRSSHGVNMGEGRASLQILNRLCPAFDISGPEKCWVPKKS